MMHFRRAVTFLPVLMTVLVLCFSVCAEEAATDTDVWPDAPVYADRVWKKDGISSKKSTLPGRYRTMEDEIVPEDETADLQALRSGMETTFISGSAQYTPEGFAEMIADIRTRTDAVICVFDLRQETHGFANGTAITLYADNNAGNVGLTAGEVLALEREQLDALVGTELTLSSSKKEKSKDPEKDAEKDPEEGSTSGHSSEPVVIRVTEVMTEAELCAAQNVRYVRISCTDHLCPENAVVDDFMAAYLALPEGAWLHFHCAAGVGRTGLFMMMADQLRNPGLPMETIIDRQVLLGANDPRNPEKNEAEDNQAKLDLLNRFHDYVQECGADGYAVTFSEWCGMREM